MAMSILEKGEAGEFIIRDKKGEPNCYGISIKVSGKKKESGCQRWNHAIPPNPPEDPQPTPHAQLQWHQWPCLA
jgi:hypothetical protein